MNTLPLRKRKPSSQSAQSFVEFAVFLPILLIMVTGLAEFGFLLNNGAPYAVRLERAVDVASGTIVVSPLTTLLAAGKAPADVLALLDPGHATTLTAADLTADPMARVLDGAVTPADRRLLAGAIAASGALQLLGGNAGSADLSGVMGVIRAKVLDVLDEPGDAGAVASAAVAVADHIAQTATSAAEAGTVAATIDAQVIGSLVAAAADTGLPVIIVDTGGGIDAGVNPGTVANHLGKGMAALEAALASGGTDDFLLAANELSAAATLVPTDAEATTGDGDKARFFGALARVALLARPYSDATDNGLNDLGDVLDGFGLASSREDRATLDPGLVLTCTTTVVESGGSGDTWSYYAVETCELRRISATSPRTGKLQAFLANQVAAGLRAAVALLDDVSPTFAATVNDDGRPIEFDHTDALFLRGVAQGMLAWIQVQYAYDFDVDLRALQQNAGTMSPQSFLNQHPYFLTLARAASIQASRGDALLAIDSFQAALASLTAEEDAQDDDAIVLDDEQCNWDGTTYLCTTTYNAAAQVTEMSDALAKVEAAARSTGNYTIDDGTTGTADDAVVNASKFFDGVNLRAYLPSRFDLGPYGDRPGMFPDPSFGGIVVTWPAGESPNTDRDLDGLPDHFGGYTRFGPWIPGTTMWGWTPGWNVQYAFSSTGNQVAAQGWSYAQGSFTAYGTYTYTATTLTLLFAGDGPGGASRVELSLDEFWDDGFNAAAEYFDGSGGSLGQSYESYHFSEGMPGQSAAPPPVAVTSAR